ncbi:hypothetical protein [Nocardiopsis synnemataformans]|uniref:hypothetical protein n=1 Tax=Nocardiopsis synnemataformans TaxID=61305 RepID=UPI003EBFC071
MDPTDGSSDLAGEAALAKLRQRIRTAFHQKNWNQQMLADRAKLSRAVVNPVISNTNSATVPSERTVTHLANALSLDAGPLLELRATAVGPATPPSSGLGKLISEWDPHDLEVHPAIAHPGRPAAAVSVPQRASTRMPGYVRRSHDDALSQAVQAAVGGSSQMVVLVGSSSTGKTRACWEAVQPLAGQGWRLWHPFNPTRAEAALDDLERVAPRTVVWLNEIQHYLNTSSGVGERVAAALHTLLTAPDRSPILILGTLWEKYANAYTTLP